MSKKKKSLKKRLIIIGSLVSTVMTALILFCVITGFNLKTFIFGTKASGNKVVEDTNLVTIVKPVPTDGSTPDAYNAMDNFSFFAYKLENSTFESITEGGATAKYNGMAVNQKVYDYRLVGKNYSVTDTRSTSTFVKIYHEQFYEGSKVLYRMGESAKYDSMTIKARSNKQEFLLYGYGPEHITGYIVCPETLVSDSGVVKNPDGTFTTTYNLDPTVAPFYYQRKVKTNASISDYPNFISVALTYTYDSNWNVIEATYNEIYSIYKMKSWIETSNSITEKFTYLTEEESEAKIKPYYDKYKSSFNLPVPADDEVSEESVTAEMGALDYLGTMAGLINNEYIKANASFDLNGKNYNVDLLINLLTYEIQMKIEDNYIIYKDNNIYFKTIDDKSYYDINELINTFAPILGLGASQSFDLEKIKTSNSIDFESIISGVMSDIGEGVVEKNDSKTNVKITFNFGDYHIPTVFVFNTPDDDTIDFEKLDASYNYLGNDINLSFKLISSFDKQIVDDSYVKLDYAYDINAKATITYQSEQFDFEGNIYLNVLNKNGEAKITLKNKDNKINLNLYFDDNNIYLMLDTKLYAKISISDLMSMVNIPETNSLELNKEEFDYKTLLPYILGLTLEIKDRGARISYNDNVLINGITVSDISVTLSISEYKNIDIPNLEFINVYDLKNLYESINNKIEDIIQSKGLSFDVSSSYNDFSLKANVYVRLDNKTVKVLANIKNVSYNLDENVEIYLIDNILYLSYKDLHISFSLDDVSLDNSNKTLDYVALFDVLKSITFDDTLNVALDISSFTTLLSDILIKITDTTEVFVETELFDVDITNINSYSDEINLTHDYSDIESYALTYKDLINLIINNESLSADISLLYEDYIVSGNVLFNKKTLDLKSNLNVLNSKDGINEDIVVYLIDNRLYLSYANMNISLPLEKILELTGGVDKPSVDTGNLTSILKGISYDNGLLLSLDIKEYVSLVTSLIINIKEDKSIAIDSNLLDLTISNINGYDGEIKTHGDFYDVSVLIDMGLDIFDLYKKQTLTISISDFKLNLGKNDLLINGDINIIDLKNIEADFVINYYGESINTIVKLINDNIYITVSNQTLVVDIKDIESYLIDVLTKVNEMLEEDIVIDLNRNIELSKILNVIKMIEVGDSIKISLDSLLEKSLLIGIIYENISGRWNLDVNTTGYITSSGNISFTTSTQNEVIAPSENLLTKSDILEILDYAIALYKLKDQNIYSATIDTYINNSNGNYFHISGDVSIKLNNGLKDFDAEAKLKIVEYRDNSKYGWHQINIIVLGGGTDSGMVYATYGNNESAQGNLVKVYLTYTGLLNLFNSIMNLMKIDTFNNMLASDTNMLDLNNLISAINVSNTSLDLVIDQNAINKNMHNSHLISISLTKTDNRISLIELDNLYITYNNDRDYMKVSNTSISINDLSALDISAPNTNGYYNLDNISYLFEDLYNDARMKDFEITGSVHMSVINIDVPLKIKVHVCEDGSPEVFISLDVPKVSALFVTLLEKKTLNIYYKDGFIYQNRIDDDKDNYLLKMSMESYMGSILPLLMGEYGLGMPEIVMDLIKDSDSEGDGFVDAAKCVKSVNMGTTEFAFTLDLKEIADNSSLGDLAVTIGTKKILWTNEDSTTEYRTILSTIKTLTLKVVSVIELSASGLEISNISKDIAGNNIVYPVDMSAYYSFIENYDANYLDDSKYSGSNGNYSFVDKISHIANFDFMDIIDDISNNYYADSKIVFPYEVGDVVFDGERYYQIEGWYSDSSYRNRILDYKNIIMPAKKKNFYANLVDITDSINNTKLYARYNMTSYEITKDSTAQIISNDVAIFDGENYLLIDSSNLNGKFLINKYLSKFEYDNETDSLVIDLVDIVKLSSYKLVTFNVDSKFNNKPYKGVYFDEYLDLALYIPNAINQDFGIDYWEVESNGQSIDMVPEMISYITESCTLTARYATRREFFNFEGSSINNYLGSAQTVVTPKYVIIDGEMVLITAISASAFEGNTSVVSVVINDGITSVGSNAFKSANSLRSVYFADSVNTVATDAFYMDSFSAFEKNRDIAKQIRFYFTSNSSIKESSLQSWLACKWNSSSRYYEKKEGTNLGLIDSSADLRDAYQTYTVSLNEVIINLI